MGINIVPTVIYASMMGMTCFALIDVLSRKRQQQSIYLGVLLLLLLAHILGELFIYSGAYQYAPALAGMQLPLRMLLGPALYFYAIATMSPDRQVNGRAYLLALTGPLLVIVGMLPFALGISSADKLALANPATRDPELWQIAFMTCLFATIAFILFTAAYLVVTFRLHARHRRQLMERFSTIEKRSMDWFRVLLVLWGAVWGLFALDFMMGFLGVRWFGSGVVLPLFEMSVLMVFTHFALKQPILEESDKAEPQRKPAKTYALATEQLQKIANKLSQAMKQDALYLEEDLSLKRLSDAISVSENQISETLSQFLNTNFFHYVNSFRVEQAKSLLLSTKNQVTSIAYEVGFNSKSTFNTAFKKSTGFTPTGYRKHQTVQSTDNFIH